MQPGGLRLGGGGRAHPPSTATGGARARAGHRQPAGQAGRLHTRPRLVWGFLSEGACLRSCGDTKGTAGPEGPPGNRGWASSPWPWVSGEQLELPSTGERAQWPEGRTDVQALHQGPGLRPGWTQGPGHQHCGGVDGGRAREPQPEVGRDPLPGSQAEPSDCTGVEWGRDPGGRGTPGLGPAKLRPPQ